MRKRLPCIATCLWVATLLLACKNDKKEEGKKPVDVFADHVRVTNFQTPEQERAGFKLPPGFEITLFASEPDISKPINMEFDAKGRLWVTNTTDYPMPSPDGKGHDHITIVEDTNGDGKADKFTQFADSLSIPIGLMPVSDGAIGYSIPNIYHFIDKDGDGKVDERKKIFGPFGFKDTHGMVSNLIRGYDGWIHACHGFTNTSTIAGTDGDSITMISGNTFRFRPDGSRVEQTTYGRVNPFGYAFDEWGYLYSVDCHSKPLYQLIRGAEYPHFGKKKPAMGFAPEMMSYELGSTALSGLDYYTGQEFPDEYKKSFYNGDVVTCRINRNTISFNGSSPESKRMDDFLISSDPWFRPVSIKTGPDGAMYVADFYNKIIGHYEVPLDHPGRDKKSGRIWKITYKGNNTAQRTLPTNWYTLPEEELVKWLNYPTLEQRMEIANVLVDERGTKAVAPVLAIMKQPNADSRSFIQGLWILYRLNALPDDVMQQALQHSDPMVQTHALHVLAEMKSLSPKNKEKVMVALQSRNPHVERAAAEVLEHFPSGNNLKPLLTAYNNTKEADSHLRYTALISIRDNLRNRQTMQQAANEKWNEAELTALMKTIPDVPLPEAAAFALNYLKTHDLSKEQLTISLEYIARYITPSRFDEAITMIRDKFPNDAENQYPLYKKMRDGIAQKGGKPGAKMQEWGTSLATSFLQAANAITNQWQGTSFEATTNLVSPWERTDGFTINQHPPLSMIWSELNGYGPTGVAHSPSFVLPAILNITVFDNDLFNSDKKTGKSGNVVRIRLSKNNSIVSEYRAKSDTAVGFDDLVHELKLDMKGYQGENGYIEIVDSSKNGSVGAGNLDSSVLKLPLLGPGNIAQRQIQASEIAADYKAVNLEPALKELLLSAKTDNKVRASAAYSLIAIDPKNHQLLTDLFVNKSETAVVREEAGSILGQSPSPQLYTLMQNNLPGAVKGLQVSIAKVLANSSQGIDYLIQSFKAGQIPVDVLMEIPVKERLATYGKPAQQQELNQLTGGKAGKDDRSQLIAERIKSYDGNSVTVEGGHAIFIQNCSPCHSIKGSGGMIAPQLDGIGNWGQKALTEKVLNPNGNISQAFRVYNITLKDGRTMSGLYRRDEGEVMVFANPGGQEFSLAKSEIKEKTASKYTLMPDQFRNTIAKKDFDALMKFLLSVK